MKTMKKIAAIVLAVVMALAMTTIAFAAGTGSITVDNAIANEDYNAYKVFDVVYNADKTAYSYTISNTSPWYATVAAYTGITLTKTAANENLFVAQQNSDFSAASFAKVLSDALENGDVQATAIELVNDGNGTATVDGLDLGYYFVTTTTGALCNLTTTSPDSVIHDKNDVPFEKDTTNGVTFDLGEEVEFEITGKVPDTTGFTAYTYEIADTMSDGLTFNADSLTVTVDGAAPAANTYTVTNTANGFVIDFDVMALSKTNVLDAIVVTYTATVNADAVAVISENNAVLTYSNDPTDSTKEEEIKDSVEVYTAQIVVDKFAAGDDQSEKLAGAEFVLYNAEGKYYSNNGTEVTWVDSIDLATKYVTDGNGVAEFDGIKDGTYYLLETAAPDGYNLLENALEVVINGQDADGNVVASQLSVEADVANSTGTILPETGGIGLTIFYIVGGLLVMGAVVMLITKRRMKAAN